jgi:signal peptidase I
VSATATPADSRALKRSLAFLGELIGIGYLYVGRISYAAGLIVATYAVLFVFTWARWVVEPAGWYAYVLCIALILVAQVTHPVVIAWRRPLAPRKSYNRWWWYLVWLGGATVLSMVMLPDPSDRAERYGYDFFRNPSSSMSPTVESGDHVVVDGWRYRDRSPQVGEVVVHRRDDVVYLKRIVGLPGDTIEVRGRTLVRNGNIVDEPYLRAAEPGLRMPNFGPRTLGVDEFFVLGD